MNYAGLRGNLVEKDPKTLPVAREDFYIRKALDLRHVEKLKQAILEGEELPPVIMVYVKELEDWRIVDGNHTAKAHELLQRPVKVFEVEGEFSYEDAIRLQLELNSIENLPVSKEDLKVMAIRQVGAKRELITQEEIAKELGVPQQTLPIFDTQSHLTITKDFSDLMERYYEEREEGQKLEEWAKSKGIELDPEELQKLKSFLSDLTSRTAIEMLKDTQEAYEKLLRERLKAIGFGTKAVKALVESFSKHKALIRKTCEKLIKKIESLAENLDMSEEEILHKAFHHEALLTKYRELFMSVCKDEIKKALSKYPVLSKEEISLEAFYKLAEEELEQELKAQYPNYRIPRELIEWLKLEVRKKRQEEERKKREEHEVVEGHVLEEEELDDELFELLGLEEEELEKERGITLRGVKKKLEKILKLLGELKSEMLSAKGRKTLEKALKECEETLEKIEVVFRRKERYTQEDKAIAKVVLMRFSELWQEEKGTGLAVQDKSALVKRVLEIAGKNKDKELIKEKFLKAVEGFFEYVRENEKREGRYKAQVSLRDFIADPFKFELMRKPSKEEVLMHNLKVLEKVLREEGQQWIR